MDRLLGKKTQTINISEKHKSKILEQNQQNYYSDDNFGQQSSPVFLQQQQLQNIQDSDHKNQTIELPIPSPEKKSLNNINDLSQQTSPNAKNNLKLNKNKQSQNNNKKFSDHFSQNISYIQQQQYQKKHSSQSQNITELSTHRASTNRNYLLEKHDEIITPQQQIGEDQYSQLDYNDYSLYYPDKSTSQLDNTILNQPTQRYSRYNSTISKNNHITFENSQPNTFHDITQQNQQQQLINNQQDNSIYQYNNDASSLRQHSILFNNSINTRNNNTNLQTTSKSVIFIDNNNNNQKQPQLAINLEQKSFESLQNNSNLNEKSSSIVHPNTRSIILQSKKYQQHNNSSDMMQNSQVSHYKKLQEMQSSRPNISNLYKKHPSSCYKKSSFLNPILQTRLDDSTSISQHQHLNRKQRFQKISELVNDKGSFLMRDRQQQLFFLKNLKDIVLKIQINPNSRFKISWDIMLTIFNIICVFIVSIQTCYTPNRNLWLEDFIVYFAHSSIFIFIADMYFGFTTGYYQQGMLQTNLRTIAQKYLKGQFYLDLFSLLGVMAAVQSDQNYFFFVLTWLIVLKVFSVQNQFVQFEEMFFSESNLKYFISLLKLFIKLICIVHIASCFFYGLGKLQHTFFKVDQTWISVVDPDQKLLYGDESLIQQDWPRQYIQSFFIVASLLMGEGLYLQPATTYEQIYIILLELLTCISIAYIINMMGQSLNSMNQEKKQFYKDMAVLNKYMKKKSIPFELQIRTRNYLEYQFLQQNEMPTEEELQTLKKIPDNLQKEIIKVSYKKIVKILLQGFQFSEELLERAAICLKEMRYSDKEIIADKNTYHDLGLYYLQTGQLNIFYDGKPGPSMQDSTIFGQEEFITGISRQYQVQSSGITLIYFLNRQEFLAILKEYNHDYQQLMMLKDQNAFQNNSFEGIGQQCIICEENNHFFTKCKYSHFVPDIDLIIKNYNHQPLITRKQYYRNNNKQNLKIRRQSDISKNIHSSILLQYFKQYIDQKYHEESQFNLSEEYDTSSEDSDSEYSSSLLSNDIIESNTNNNKNPAINLDEESLDQEQSLEYKGSPLHKNNSDQKNINKQSQSQSPKLKPNNFLLKRGISSLQSYETSEIQQQFSNTNTLVESYNDFANDQNDEHSYIKDFNSNFNTNNLTNIEQNQLQNQQQQKHQNSSSLQQVLKQQIQLQLQQQQQQQQKNHHNNKKQSYIQQQLQKRASFQQQHQQQNHHLSLNTNNHHHHHHNQHLHRKSSNNKNPIPSFQTISSNNNINYLGQNLRFSNQQQQQQIQQQPRKSLLQQQQSKGISQKLRKRLDPHTTQKFTENLISFLSNQDYLEEPQQPQSFQNTSIQYHPSLPQQQSLTQQQLLLQNQKSTNNNADIVLSQPQQQQQQQQQDIGYLTTLRQNLENYFNKKRVSKLGKESISNLIQFMQHPARLSQSQQNNNNIDYDIINPYELQGDQMSDYWEQKEDKVKDNTDIDTQKIYEYYFAYHNYNKIIHKLQKISDLNEKKLKKRIQKQQLLKQQQLDHASKKNKKNKTNKIDMNRSDIGTKSKQSSISNLQSKQYLNSNLTNNKIQQFSSAKFEPSDLKDKNELKI